MPRIASRLPTAVPEVLGAGRPGEGYPWPWTMYRWLLGEHPRAGALESPVSLAEELAEFVLAMRSIALSGAPKAYRGGPLAKLDAATRSAIERLRAIPEENVVCDAVLALWEQASQAPCLESPVWLHADLMPGNLLVDGDRLSAVIDFGCLGVDDPACDLFPAWNLLPADEWVSLQGRAGCRRRDLESRQRTDTFPGVDRTAALSEDQPGDGG